KTWVGARISIAPDDINAVNTPHTFTITLEKQLVDGSFVVLAGKTVTAAVTAGSCTGPTPSSGTTDVNGQLTVVVNNTDVGSCTVTARFNDAVDTGDPDTTVDIKTDGTGGNSDPATKTWVGARISIAPDDTNAVNTPHTFTVTLEKQFADGTFAALAGKTVTTSVTAGSCSYVGSSSGTTDANGHLT